MFKIQEKIKLTGVNFSATWSKQSKIGQVYKTIVFKTLDITKWITINPEKGKQIVQALNLSQTATEEEFVRHAVGSGKAGRASGCPEPRA